MTERFYYVYILTNLMNTVLYTGVTNSLPRRIWEHREKQDSGFTAKYNLSRLVYYEQHQDIGEAITWEKRLKRWRRAWKDELITQFNPAWRDLFADLLPDE